MKHNVTLNCLRVVDELNEIYGSEYYLPVEYIYLDGQHFIKGFGKYLFDSERYPYEETVVQIFNVINKEINERILKVVHDLWIEKVKFEVLSAIHEETGDYGNIYTSVEDVLENL